MNFLIGLLFVAAFGAGYLVTHLVPEEIKPGKQWFVRLTILFGAGTLIFAATTEWSIATMDALAATLFFLGSVLRSRS